MPNRDITTRAAEGSIDIHALTRSCQLRRPVEMSVSMAHSARTNALFHHDIRWRYTAGVAGLSSGHPMPQVYRFYVVAASASPLNIEYPARGAEPPQRLWLSAVSFTAAVRMIITSKTQRLPWGALKSRRLSRASISSAARWRRTTSGSTPINACGLLYAAAAEHPHLYR